MTFTVSPGWWMLPALVTVLAFAWRWWVHKDDRPASGYGAIGQGLYLVVTFLLALVPSLGAWLVWALLT